jgi:hypothetical protein
LCSSPNITRAIKPRRIFWAGHVARTSLELKSLQEIGRSEGLGLTGKLILKEPGRNRMGRHGLD